jgi:SAM-dependent methyltransferase
VISVSGTVACPARVAARVSVVLLAALLQGCALLEHAEPTIITGGDSPTLIPEVPFVWSPDEAVDAMLKLAGVGPQDVVYDLGCGDGRIVIAAAAKYGARGVGIDIDPAPLRFAAIGAKRAGVSGRVRFVRGDLFEADVREATVVALYLFENVNRRLLPKLLRELSPGARIVSHKFTFGDDWLPEKTAQAGDSTVYLWTVPKR